MWHGWMCDRLGEMRDVGWVDVGCGMWNKDVSRTAGLFVELRLDKVIREEPDGAQQRLNLHHFTHVE